MNNSHSWKNSQKINIPEEWGMGSGYIIIPRLLSHGQYETWREKNAANEDSGADGQAARQEMYEERKHIVLEWGIPEVKPGASWAELPGPAVGMFIAGAVQQLLVEAQSFPK
jgi:hypothetical protein